MVALDGACRVYCSVGNITPFSIVAKVTMDSILVTDVTLDVVVIKVTMDTVGVLLTYVVTKVDHLYHLIPQSLVILRRGWLLGWLLG